MDHPPILGQVEDIVTVAHALRAEFKQRMLGAVEPPRTPEYPLAKVTAVVIAEDRCPRDLIGFKDIDKLDRCQGTAKAIARQRDKIGANVLDQPLNERKRRRAYTPPAKISLS